MKKLIILLGLSLFSLMSYTQTTYINGTTGNGNFESGATGWSTANHTSNKWFIGSTAKCSGTNGAYVGTASGNNNYTNTTTNISHLYKTTAIAFTGGETTINLSFSYKGQGESTYDGLKVYLRNTIPIAGTSCAGAEQVGSTWYNLTGSCATANITVPAAYAGTTKYLVFQWQNDGSVGTNPAISIDNIVLTSSGPPPAPANDLCADATALPCGTTNLAGTTINSTNVTNGTSCSMGDYGVWYSFVGDGQSTTISSTATFDHEMSISSGSCGSLSNIVCNDGSTGTESHTFTTTSGVTYFVYIAHYSGSTTGTFTISRSCVSVTPPANDDCTGAISLTVNPDLTCTTTTSGTIENATASTQSAASCGGTEDDDVWFSFVATGTTHTIDILNVAGSTTDMYHSVWSGTCPSLTLVAGTCSDPNSQTVTGLTAGNTYYIRVYSWTSTAGQTSTFDVCVGTPPPPPSNDLCADATPLPCGTTNLVGTTVNSTNVASGISCGSNYGVWYTFVGDGNQTTITVNNSYDIDLSITSGSCGSLTNVVCKDSPENHTFTTTNGVTYFVYISYWTTGATTGTFTISRSCTAAPTPPVNDECTGAISLTVNPDLTCTTTTSGTIENATASGEANSCYGSDDDDVWFSFVATATTHYVDLLNVAGSVTDMYHVLYEGPCGSLTELYCSDANSSTASGLTIGNTYFIRVYTYTSTGGQNSTFDLCITSDPPPITACSGTFYDSGGSGGDYSSNEDYVQTFCSSTPGLCLKMTFSSFNTESYDKLTIYNGPDVSSPEIGIYSGTSLPNGGVITANSGCLTIKWHSDGSVNYAGWAATISCVTCPVASCNDGVQNGDETGVDCGGSLCDPCTTPADVCEDANPFCSDLVYNFPTTVDGGSAVVGPDYGCLGSQPNPVWYFLQIDGNGDLEIEIASDCGDVDYAAWGPFPAVTCANSDLTTSGNFMYEDGGASTSWAVDAFSAPSGNMIDCSYDIDAVEYLYIPNAVVDDYYVVMISNYKNCDGLLTFSQISGTGSSNCSIVLPIELLNFSGYAENGYNLLEWTTTTEINNDFFEIEKSTDGVLFNKIGEIDGAGNSSTNKTYQYIDNNPSLGISYYRLRQVDYNGVFTYSNVVAVKQSTGAEVSIFPNPTKGKVKLNFVSKEEGTYTINVYDISKEIYKEQLFIDKGNKVISFDLFEQLSKGFYIVKVTDKNGNILRTERIIKH